MTATLRYTLKSVYLTQMSWDLLSRDTGEKNPVSFYRRAGKKGFYQDTELPI